MPGLSSISAELDLRDDQKCLRLDKTPRLNSVKMDPARECRPVEFHLVRSCFLLSLNQGGNLLTECVVDRQEHLWLVWQSIAEHRARIEGIRWYVKKVSLDFSAYIVVSTNNVPHPKGGLRYNGNVLKSNSSVKTCMSGSMLQRRVGKSASTLADRIINAFRNLRTLKCWSIISAGIFPGPRTTQSTKPATSDSGFTENLCVWG